MQTHHQHTIATDVGNVRVQYIFDTIAGWVEIEQADIVVKLDGKLSDGTKIWAPGTEKITPLPHQCFRHLETAHDSELAGYAERDAEWSYHEAAE